MDFRITGLASESFAHLFDRSDAELAERGAIRCVVDAEPGFPDRVTLRDLAVGEPALLVNYVHQPADTVYRASHAIFVLARPAERFDRVGEVPEAFRIRTMSLRAFDARGMMRDADLVEGRKFETLVERLFSDPEVAEVQAHYAKRGCFAATIARA